MTETLHTCLDISAAGKVQIWINEDGNFWVDIDGVIRLIVRQTEMLTVDDNRRLKDREIPSEH